MRGKKHRKYNLARHFGKRGEGLRGWEVLERCLHQGVVEGESKHCECDSGPAVPWRLAFDAGRWGPLSTRVGASGASGHRRVDHAESLTRLKLSLGFTFFPPPHLGRNEIRLNKKRAAAATAVLDGEEVPLCSSTLLCAVHVYEYTYLPYPYSRPERVRGRLCILRERTKTKNPLT
jgi:hypothetical protein